MWTHNICYFVFDNSTQTRDTGEEGLPTEELPPSDWRVGGSVGIFLINDWCGKAPPTVGGVPPPQVVLDVGEQAKQTMENKPITSIPLWSLLHFLPSGATAEFWPWL